MSGELYINLIDLIKLWRIRPELVHHGLDVSVLQVVLALQSVDGLLHLHRVLTEALTEEAHWLRFPHIRPGYFLLHTLDNFSPIFHIWKTNLALKLIILLSV